MPRITCLRVANIQYDSGKKQLPDIIIEPNGLNTVLLLANGGGKTLLIQLIVQTILPNEKMGGRKIADLLLSNQYTGHVAVEWLLDDTGEKRRYVCTGFCFTQGFNQDQRIRYFNYYFDYEDFSGLHIKTLPFIQEDERGMRHPLGYVQLKDFLKKETENRVQVLEERKKYQDQLRHYQILPEEWKNICETNGSEGGVDKFFEKSKTTHQLLVNLLIPSIEDMVFQSERKKQELLNTFREYRNLLIEIPVTKKNIKDFDVIQGHAQGLVDEIEALNGLQQEHSGKTKELVVLGKTFAAMLEKAQKEAEDLENKQQQKRKHDQELRWQRESHGVFEKQLAYKEAQQKVEDLGTAQAVQEKHWHQAQEKGNQLKALHVYQKLLEARLDVQKYEAELANMEKEQPELQRELQEKRRQLRGAWEEKQGVLHKLLREHEEKHEELQGLNGQAEQGLRETREQEGKIQKDLAKLESWFEQYQEHQKGLLSHISQGEVLEPEKALARHEKTLAQDKRAALEILGDIERLTKEQEEFMDTVSQGKTERIERQTQRKSFAEKIEQYEQQQENLRSVLAENELYIKTLWQEKEKVLLWVQNALGQAREDRVMGQGTLANLEEKWVLLGDRNYYIPHGELLKIKQHLRKKDMYVVLGSEWLMEQQATEEEKQAYIKHQPLLPYAIIIEPNQVNGVYAAMKQRKEWIRDFPLLFLVKNKDSLRQGIVENERFLALGNELLFYQPQSHRLFLSAPGLKQFKEDLAQEIDKLKGQVQNLLDLEDKYVQLREQVKSFYQSYDQQQIEAWYTGEKEAARQIKILDAHLEAYEKQKQGYKEQLARKQQERESLQEAVRKEEHIISKLQDYLRDYRLCPAKRTEEEQRQRALSAVQGQLLAIEQQRDSYFQGLAEIKQRIREHKRAMALHEKDYQGYQLGKIENPGAVAKEYEAVKAEVDAVLEMLKQKQSNRRYVEELLQKAREREQDFQTTIRNTGVQEPWLQENQRWVLEDEVWQAEQEAAEQSQRLEDLKEACHGAKNKAEAIRSVLLERTARIKNQFDLEPYLAFSKTDHLLEYQSILEGLAKLQEELVHLEQQILATKEWQRELQEAYEMIAETYALALEQWEQGVEPLSGQDWEAYRGKPQAVVRRCEKDLEALQNLVLKQQRIVDRKLQDYLGKLESTDNPKVKQFIRDINAIVDNNRIYDYDFMETQFLRIFEGIDQYKKQFQHTLQEQEKNKVLFIELCLRRAKTVYDSIMEMQQNAKVTLYQREIQVIRMDWYAAEGQEARERMDAYLQRVLEDLQKWKQEGLDEDELNRRAEDFLQTRNLIQIMAPLEDCRIIVYKPRKESLMRTHKLDYFPWDEVCRWSGGEEYSIYITMFMVMISHIRQQTQGSRKAWKVIMADNPFGRASSPHILETVFQVAKSNQIQLICLTAHRQDSILQRFPVVYSLQLRHAYGKEVMKAEQMETGFYRYESAYDKSGQMVLFPEA